MKDQITVTYYTNGQMHSSDARVKSFDAPSEFFEWEAKNAGKVWIGHVANLPRPAGL